MRKELLPQPSTGAVNGEDPSPCDYGCVLLSDENQPIFLGHNLMGCPVRNFASRLIRSFFFGATVSRSISLVFIHLFSLKIFSFHFTFSPSFLLLQSIYMRVDLLLLANTRLEICPLETLTTQFAWFAHLVETDPTHQGASGLAHLLLVSFHMICFSYASGVNTYYVKLMLIAEQPVRGLSCEIWLTSRYEQRFSRILLQLNRTNFNLHDPNLTPRSFDDLQR